MSPTETLHVNATQPAAPQNAPAPATPEPVVQSAEVGGFAITSFVLGVASILSGWFFFVPLTGLIFGILSRNRQEGNRTLCTWGIVLNSVMLVIWLLILAFVALLLLFLLPSALV